MTYERPEGFRNKLYKTPLSCRPSINCDAQHSNFCFQALLFYFQAIPICLHLAQFYLHLAQFYLHLVQF